MTYGFDLLSVLGLLGLSQDQDIKMYRHVDHPIGESYYANMEDIYASGQFEVFQSRHRGRDYGNNVLVSFIGEAGRLARFVGVWKVKGIIPGAATARVPADMPFYKALDADNPWTELEYDHRFQDLVDRLVVRWPDGRGAHRWLVKRSSELLHVDIQEIRPMGFRGRFPGFDHVLLKHHELVSMERHGDGGGGWIDALRSTRAVYLITDVETGDLYVGSATGANGLWGRWSSYARSVHGGNKLIIDAVQRIEKMADRLQFSVLETLSNLANGDDGREAERRWKRKLGKKATILNAN